MIFTNARLIFPDGIRDGLEVVVEEGKIAAIRPPTPRLRRTGERVRGKRSLISMEIILRPVLSIFMCTARLAATRWKPRLKRFARFAISTRVAARHRFCSRQRLRLSTKSSRSCKRFAIFDQRSVRLSVFMSKGHSFRKRKPERNAPNSFRTRHRLLCGSCSNTRTYSSV